MLIERFEWDRANEAKVQTHGLTAREVDSVVDGKFVLLRNKRDRAGSHRLIGRSLGGRMITVVIRPSMTRGTWRPVNAWPSDAEELAHARRARI